MKKGFFFFVFTFLIALPCAVFMTGCSKEQLIGISAQKARFEISYGQKFDPMTKFNIRSHYVDGTVTQLGENELTYTITKNDEIYELNDLFDAGNYIITFAYQDVTCDTYLNVKKVEYQGKSNILIDNFFFNDTVSAPELDEGSDGNVTYYYAKISDGEEEVHTWEYLEDDINTTITPGNYRMYGEVDEGTNYKSYRTSETTFHVSPEKLDDSYSLSLEEFTATYKIDGKLSDYEDLLNDTLKLQKYDEDTETTEEITGAFNFVEGQKKIGVADSGKSILIAFNSPDENLNGKEFLLPINIEKLKITQPNVTTSNDLTDIKLETIYDGDEQSLKIVTDYLYTFDDEEEIYTITAENGAPIAYIGGKLKGQAISTYDFHISLADKENTLWEDETTTDVDSEWVIRAIPFTYADKLVFKFITDDEIINSIESPNDLTDDMITYLKDGQNLQYEQSKSGAYYGFVGACIYDETTSHYVDLPDIYSVILYQTENPDIVIYGIYTNKDEDGNVIYNENGEIVNTQYGNTILVPHLTPDQLPYELELVITIEGDEIHESTLYTAEFTIRK